MKQISLTDEQVEVLRQAYLNELDDISERIEDIQTILRKLPRGKVRESLISDKLALLESVEKPVPQAAAKKGTSTKKTSKTPTTKGAKKKTAAAPAAPAAPAAAPAAPATAAEEKPLKQARKSKPSTKTVKPKPKTASTGKVQNRGREAVYKQGYMQLILDEAYANEEVTIDQLTKKVTDVYAILDASALKTARANVNRYVNDMVDMGIVEKRKIEGSRANAFTLNEKGRMAKEAEVDISKYTDFSAMPLSS